MFIRAVRQTSDLQRIKSLPRRTLTREWATRQAARFTRELAKVSGVALMPWQGAALAEAKRTGTGACLWFPVGIGKTLVAETMPVVLEAQRSVLILNASLVDKTYKDRRALRAQWKIANPPARIITREALALEANAYLLDQIDPDLIIIDESDEFSNFDASATQRIHRFWVKRAKAGNPVKVVSMTGTPSRRSIMAVWHHLIWCLGDMAPVPLLRSDAEQWAAALDDAAPRQGFRPSPGALGATLEDARTWYLDRLRSTPGVVIVDEDSAGDIPLHVSVELAPHCADIEAAFDELRVFWRSPSGEPVSDPLSLARIAGQIGCGLVTYYEPPPPQRWREGRSGAAKFIRERISQTRHAQRPLDTDAQVMRAHPEHPAVVEWKAVKPTYDPLKHTRVRWISDATLQWAAAWLTSTKEPSILWCGSVEFADKLSKLVRMPYFGPKGREVRSGRGLHEADTTRSMVCSWHANKRGFNLQAWRRNGVIMPPQSAKYLEQMFGRAHRQGQTEAVHWTILATSGDTLDSFAAAIGEAAFVAETTGLHQKLLRAEIEDLPTPPKTLRWATRE